MNGVRQCLESAQWKAGEGWLQGRRGMSQDSLIQINNNALYLSRREFIWRIGHDWAAEKQQGTHRLARKSQESYLEAWDIKNNPEDSDLDTGWENENFH